MKTITGGFCTVLTFCFILLFSCEHASAHITILKNSGGGNLIENTLVAATVSISQGADYLGLPINMSADDQLVVFKDTTLNRLTDVADVFPTKYRDDGNYYVVDFSLGELRQLRLRNVFEEESSSLALGIPTLKEELTLIRSLNSLLNKETGVVLTLQDPAFYNKEGKGLSRELQRTLQLLSYTPQDKLFIECSDPDELQKISRWPRAENGDRFSLIQQVQLKQSRGEVQPEKAPIMYQHDWLFTNSGLRILASYATAVALPSELVKINSPAIDNLMLSLRNYGIKIFVQSENNSSQREIGFDGAYLDSIDVTPVQDGKKKSISTLNPDPQTEESTLPPFFSNLGLSQPNNTGKQTGSTSIDESFSEEPQ